MKKLVYTAVFILISSGAFAQGMFGISYDISLPMGPTSDFIENASFRGFSIEGRGFLYDNFALGGEFGWHIFYGEYGPQEWKGKTETSTIYGKQYRYINSLPIMATAHYYFGVPDATRFYIGVGLGTANVLQRTDLGLYYVESNTWRFAVAPEVGVLLPINPNFIFNVGAKYQYATKASDADALNYLTFKIGFAFM